MLRTSGVAIAWGPGRAGAARGPAGFALATCLRGRRIVDFDANADATGRSEEFAAMIEARRPGVAAVADEGAVASGRGTGPDTEGGVDLDDATTTFGGVVARAGAAIETNTGVGARADDDGAAVWIVMAAGPTNAAGTGDGISAVGDGIPAPVAAAVGSTEPRGGASPSSVTITGMGDGNMPGRPIEAMPWSTVADGAGSGDDVPGPDRVIVTKYAPSRA